MAELNYEKIKKLKKGELFGTAATVFCAVVLVYFAVCFALARTMEIRALELAVLISAPVLGTAGVAAAAFCSIKYGGALGRGVKRYVLDTCVENAALMHPERDSLSFYISMDEANVTLKVNNFKEPITFDFSAFGKLSLTRKISVLTEIESRLCATFCRLYERGASYKEVGWAENAGRRGKSGKTVYIIQNGVPDKKAYKNYLKNK